MAKVTRSRLPWLSTSHWTTGENPQHQEHIGLAK
jgi:hypothetical protein